LATDRISSLRTLQLAGFSRQKISKWHWIGGQFENKKPQNCKHTHKPQ